MIRIYIICEGITEKTFIDRIIAPLFASLQVILIPRLISTSKGHKGGALTYERVKRYIITCLKGEKNTKITTFFDLYALDKNFPDFENSQKLNDIYQKVNQLELAFKNDIVKENPSFGNRFFPYIQPYEFEGLLFSNIEKLIDIDANWKSSCNDLKAIRNEFPSPVHINNSKETAPSSRLKTHLYNPKYRKVLHGILGIENIGIDTILTECKHFNE